MLRHNATKQNKIYDWESARRLTKSSAKRLTNETKRFGTEREQLRLLLQELFCCVEVFFRSLRFFSHVFAFQNRISTMQSRLLFYARNRESANYDHYRIRPKFVVDRGIAQGTARC